MSNPDSLIEEINSHKFDNPEPDEYRVGVNVGLATAVDIITTIGDAAIREDAGHTGTLVASPARSEIWLNDKLFELVCEEMERIYRKTDDDVKFHDVGALRGYIHFFLKRYIAMLPKREIGEDGIKLGQFSIFRRGDKIAIHHESGEGGDFSEHALILAITKFYTEHF